MISMILRVLKTVLSVVLHLLAIVLKIVYNILAFLRVRLLALYLVVCGIVQLIFHTFSGEAVVWFWAGFALCVFVTLLAWVWTVRKKLKRRAREEEPEREEGTQEEEIKEPSPKKESPVRYPRYFDAEGRDGYIFAEYADRFELYRREGDEYVLERVDEKPLEKRA